MIIAVDGNEANVKERVGVSVYALNLLKYFRKHADKNTVFKIFLKNRPLEDLPEENKYFRYEVIPGKVFWLQFFLPLHLFKKNDFDVYFSTAHYLPCCLKTPSVVTVHDLSYIFFPQDFLKKDLYKLKNWTKKSVYKATKIIAVSKTTKQDIVKSYEIDPQKITVIYNGYEKKSSLSETKLKDKNTKHPYILYVGTLQPRKNITTLITAFAKYKQFYPDFKLVIAGKKGWLYEKIFNLSKKLGLEDEIYFTDYISNNQLIYLYENAFCFVLPSFYEGFGIPPLEAMSFGCPVISSISSSLPEVSGNAALYFDPDDPYDLVEKLKKLKNDPDMRKNLTKKGYERIKLFSWNDCAQKTLSTIKSAVSQPVSRT